MIDNCLNFYVFNHIISLLKDDIDKLNFVRICKGNYSYRNHVRLNNFPTDFYCKSTRHGILAYKYHKLSVRKKNWKYYKKYIANRIDVNIIQFFEKVPEELTASLLPKSLALHSITMVEYNYPLPPGVIPSSVQTLLINYSYKKPMVIGSLPDSIVTLSLTYSHPLVPGLIPYGVKTLQLGGGIFQAPLLQGIIPNSVLDLHLGISGTTFSHPLPQYIIPEGVKKLTFGSRFNHIIRESIVPKSCEVLMFGMDFNQPIQPGTLPDSLKTLGLGFSFSQNLVRGSVPSGVKTLCLGYKFSQKLTIETIPHSLDTLYIDSDFNPLSDFLPKSLKRIILTKLTLYQIMFRDPIFNLINLFKITSADIDKHINFSICT